MSKRFFAFVLALLLCASTVFAAPAAEDFRFSSADFLPENSEDLQGIFITSVPKDSCTLSCLGRVLRAGDTLTAEQLSELVITPDTDVDTVAEMNYLPIFTDQTGSVQTLSLSLRGRQNHPPVANDSEIETYKNLEICGELSCSDPDGDSITLTLQRQPKRGTVVLNSDGSFVYTPKKNKVGTDSFSYTAADSSGNVTDETTVTVHILNPRIKGTFADMNGDPNEFEARFLRENEILSGENIGGALCFCPDKSVTEQEFLMMLMKTTNIVADEVDTDSTEWFTPWQNAALRAGIAYEASASEAIAGADAAILVANVLDLNTATTVSVFADAQVSHAALSAAALEEAGIPCTMTMESEITRRDAAILLFNVSRYCREKALEFPWQT